LLDTLASKEQQKSREKVTITKEEGTQDASSAPRQAAANAHQEAVILLSVFQNKIISSVAGIVSGSLLTAMVYVEPVMECSTRHIYYAF